MSIYLQHIHINIIPFSHISQKFVIEMLKSDSGFLNIHPTNHSYAFILSPYNFDQF